MQLVYMKLCRVEELAWLLLLLLCFLQFDRGDWFNWTTLLRFQCADDLQYGHLHASVLDIHGEAECA